MLGPYLNDRVAMMLWISLSTCDTKAQFPMGQLNYIYMYLQQMPYLLEITPDASVLKNKKEKTK